MRSRVNSRRVMAKRAVISGDAGIRSLIGPAHRDGIDRVPGQVGKGQAAAPPGGPAAFRSGIAAAGAGGPAPRRCGAPPGCWSPGRSAGRSRRPSAHRPHRQRAPMASRWRAGCAAPGFLPVLRPDFRQMPPQTFRQAFRQAVRRRSPAEGPANVSGEDPAARARRHPGRRAGRRDAGRRPGDAVVGSHGPCPAGSGVGRHRPAPETDRCGEKTVRGVSPPPARQAQLCDDGIFLSKHRTVVKDYFPIQADFFPIMAIATFRRSSDRYRRVSGI